MINISIDERIMSHQLWPSNRRKSEFTKFEAYIYLVMLIEIKDGVFKTSILKLAREWSWSRTKVRAFLEEINLGISIARTKDNILIKKGIKKNIEKNTEKDTKKDMVKLDNLSMYSELKDTKKDTKKNIEKNIIKDTKKNIEDDDSEMNLDSIINILKM